MLGAIREREMRRAELRRAIEASSRAVAQLPDLPTARAELVGRLSEWRTLLRGHVEQGQQLLKPLIDGRLVMTPDNDSDGPYYRFRGLGSWWNLLAGVGPTWRPIVAALRPQMVASPAGFDTRYPDNFEGIWVSDRAA